MERLSVEEPIQTSRQPQPQERKRSKSLTDWAMKTFRFGSDINFQENSSFFEKILSKKKFFEKKSIQKKFFPKKILSKKFFQKILSKNSSLKKISNLTVNQS